MPEVKEKVEPIWKCRMADCKFTSPPTIKGFQQQAGHQFSHRGIAKDKRGFNLIDSVTGEVLAQTLKEAEEKGLLEPPKAKVEEPKAKVEPPKEPLKAEPPSNVPEMEEKGMGEITTVKSAGVFTYEITLPADAFTLFNLAKACGLETNDGKLFDEWVWDCIRARFSKDYKKQLVLAPLEE